MKFDAIRFFKDHNIPFWTSGRNCVPGHISIKCPFCDDHSNHNHVNPNNGCVCCFRCKSGSLTSLVSKLLHLPFEQAAKLIEEYSDGTVSKIVNRKSAIVYRTTPIILPGKRLNARMKAYLEERGFDAEYLEKKYGLLGTMGNTFWEGVDFSWRIIIPVYDSYGHLVSFQARDWTGLAELRYKNAPIEKSILDPKNLLYNSHLAHKTRVVVVEGIFDAWRLGDGFVCSFGTSMRQEQLRLLSEWGEVIFMFDAETEAQAHAKHYAQQLASVGCKTSVVEGDFGLNAKGEPKDPAELTEAEAYDVRRELLL